jgi:hypothetical protein
MSFVRKNLFALVRVAKDQFLTVHANKALSGQPKALIGRYEYDMKYAVVMHMRS